MSLFFTADTHFNHARIIEHCKRPFADVNAMNAELIRRWNTAVQPSDDVYVLGDFAYKRAEGWPIADIFRQLHGHKHLILGNHDQQARGVEQLGWVRVTPLVTVRWEGWRFEVCHYPLETWKNAARGYLHLHGHSHGSLKRVIPHRYDVGVDTMWAGFAPLSVHEILERATAETFDPQDHHGD
jgi:calcineurin-like phosphoesterase family protein